jgi:sugar O-acyltransferase (sialic acid O-acetyltransferase NeuD family)
LDVLEQHGGFAPAGLIGLPQEVGLSPFGYPVLGSDADLPMLIGQYRNALVAIGQISSPDLRIRAFISLQRAGASLPCIVSPRAYVSPHATLGSGTIVMHGAIINAGAMVGANCIINSQALIEHEAQVADHCHISTAVAVNGCARIGTGTFVGSNSSIREGIVLGERCVIGMGQRVLSSYPNGTRLIST